MGNKSFTQLVVQEKCVGDFRAFLYCRDSEGAYWSFRGYGSTAAEAANDALARFNEPEEGWDCLGYPEPRGANQTPLVHKTITQLYVAFEGELVADATTEQLLKEGSNKVDAITRHPNNAKTVLDLDSVVNPWLKQGKRYLFEVTITEERTDE